MPSLKRRRGCPQSTAPGWRATAAGLLVVICIVFLSPAQHVTRNTFAGLAVGVIASVIGNTLTNTWFGEQQPVHPVPQAMTAHRLPTVETGPQPVDRSPVIRPSKPAKKAAPTASVANRSQPDARSPVELPQLLTISDLPRPATVEPPRLLSILGDDLPRLTTGADPPPLTFISDLPRLTTGTDDLPRPIGKPSQLLIYSPDDPPPPATVELPQLLTISDLPRPATVEPPRLLNILSDDLPPATVEPSRLLSILGDDLPRLTTGHRPATADLHQRPAAADHRHRRPAAADRQTVPVADLQPRRPAAAGNRRTAPVADHQRSAAAGNRRTAPVADHLAT